MKLTSSKFRSPITNARYTTQLFWDQQVGLMVDKRVIDPMFTLHRDVEGLINFRKEYLKDMDPTGYKTSARLLENYDHFLLLMKCNWFKAAKAEWDKELAAKMEAEALDVLRGIAKGGEDIKISEQISAAKVMLGKAKTVGAKKETVESKRGRPTNEEVQGALKEETRLEREFQEDLKRIQGVDA